MSTFTHPPRLWREVANIPGYLPVSELEIRADDLPDKESKYEGYFVEIRWKRSVGLDWSPYRLVRVARVYGETHLLLEKSDQSRAWSSLRDVGHVRLLPTK